MPRLRIAEPRRGLGIGVGGAGDGTQTVKVEPAPNVLSTAARPPSSRRGGVERQPARSAEAARGRLVHLREVLKEARQHLGGNADAGVAHREDHAGPAVGLGRLHTERDVAPFGELDGVGEEVAQHLQELHAIGLDHVDARAVVT
jgi:hypothetical protein